MAMQKKAAPEEPAGESAPAWMVSFADLVTLMFSFFVVLYALKQGGEKQQLEQAAAIKAVFDPGYAPPLDSQSEFDQAIRRFRGQPGPAYPNSGGHAAKPTDGATGLDQTVTSIRPGRQIVTGTRITFEANSPVLDPAGIDAIDQIADKIRGLNNILYVKGHVSGDEIALRPDDPEGLTLSYLRASRVIEEFVKLGIDRRVLRALPCGSYEPLKTGAYDPDTLKLNRRVEIFATENIASDFSPMNTVPATQAPTAARDQGHGAKASGSAAVANAAEGKTDVGHP
jgi:chemotaxis protein MotB